MGTVAYLSALDLWLSCVHDVRTLATECEACYAGSVVTDAEILSEIVLMVLEDPAFSSGLWTLAEVLGYLNLRQQRFLKATKVTAATAIVPWTIGQPEAPLPTDWIDTVCARWHALVEDRWTPLTAADSFELDHMTPETALTVNPPQGWRLSDLETLRMVVGPPPIAPGEAELIYVSLAVALDGSGIAPEIPDALCPYLKYGVLADMLGKEGRGQDRVRARYCETRFEEGIALAGALLDGLG